MLKPIITLAFLLISFSPMSLAAQEKEDYQAGYTEQGIISYYTARFDNRKTASGEIFDNQDLVASHRRIPFDSKVKITNLSNGKSVIVRINDRGPYAYGRMMDVSEAAARKIGLISSGTIKAEIEVLGSKKAEEKREEELILANPTEVDEESALFKTGNTYSEWGTEKTPVGFGLQVAAFDDLANAKIFCKKLRQRGLTNEYIYIQVGWQDNARKFRILVGDSDQEEDLKRIEQRVRLAGYTGFRKPHFSK